MEGIELVNKVNRLLKDESLSLTKIAKMLGIGRSTIARRCEKVGYKYDETVKQYIFKEEYNYSDTKDITKISKELPEVYNYSNTKDINNIIAVQKYFKNVTEEDLIKFKKVIDNIDKLVDIVDKRILMLDIPYEESPYQTTIKVNKAVFEQFKEKCKRDFPYYSIKDLTTHAFQMFIEMY